jgi:regulator of protease activity HflC (stomatin/prohibitin superfamily)
MKKKIFAVVIAICAIAFIASVGKLWEQTDRSKIYVCQMPVSGEYRVWSEGKLEWQGLGDVDAYNKTSQVVYEGLKKEGDDYILVGENPAAKTTFNDNGKGYIIGSFRVEMPTDTKSMEKIQEDYGSEEALINALVKPQLYKVITACGPLMTSLESVAETRTDLIAHITDQLNNGVYKTRVIKVEVPNAITGEMETRNQADLIEDPNAPGGYLRQEESPFGKYGIKCGQVSVIDIKYDDDTQAQIDAQRNANLAAITLKTQALEFQQQAIKAEEEGKAEAAKARWKQEKEKAIAVTKAQQEFEVAELEAKKAKQVALKVQAEGEAKAAANRALVQAGLTPLEKATIEKETAIGIAQALANSNVRWVPEIIMNGGSNAGSAMDAVGLNMMMDVVKKMNSNK